MQLYIVPEFSQICLAIAKLWPVNYYHQLLPTSSHCWYFLDSKCGGLFWREIPIFIQRISQDSVLPCSSSNIFPWLCCWKSPPISLPRASPIVGFATEATLERSGSTDAWGVAWNVGAQTTGGSWDGYGRYTDVVEKWKPVGSKVYSVDEANYRWEWYVMAIYCDII